MKELSNRTKGRTVGYDARSIQGEEGRISPRLGLTTYSKPYTQKLTVLESHLSGEIAVIIKANIPTG